jgi:hypothetical protein
MAHGERMGNIRGPMQQAAAQQVVGTAVRTIQKLVKVRRSAEGRVCMAHGEGMETAWAHAAGGVGSKWWAKRLRPTMNL